MDGKQAEGNPRLQGRQRVTQRDRLGVTSAASAGDDRGRAVSWSWAAARRRALDHTASSPPPESRTNFHAKINSPLVL